MSAVPDAKAAVAGRSPTRGAARTRLPIAPRRAKVLRDLGEQKARTVLVVLSIAVGVFAVGMIIGTRQILNHQLYASYAAINPSDAILGVNGFDADLLAAIQRMPEVETAGARFSLYTRANLGAGRWLELTVFALPNWDDIPLNIVRPVSGPWPPPRDAIVVERMSLPMLEAAIGDVVELELPDGRMRAVQVVGAAHDINLPPARFTNQAFAYTTFDTLEHWGIPKRYTSLSIRAVAPPAGPKDQAYVQSVTRLVQDKVERSGDVVNFSYVAEPGKHPADEVLTPVFLLLGALGLLSLFLSAFLVVNTIAAVMAQQVRQIGVMKTVGARLGQIVRLYLGLVLIFGLLALLIALPAGVAGAYGFSIFLAQFMNFDVVYEGVPLTAVGVQVAVGLLVPLLAASVPVYNGARVTIREAISTYGLGHGRFGQGPVDRFLVASQQFAPWLSRPLVVSLRNTFRRKGRLLLTMVTLTLGGAIFVAVLSVRASLYQTVDDALRANNFHVVIGFNHDARVEVLQQEALQTPGVVVAESWGRATARRQRPDAQSSADEPSPATLSSRSQQAEGVNPAPPGMRGGESDEIRLQAPPVGSRMIQPQLVAGRWLLPEDENALVANTNFMDAESDVAVGDTITLRIDGKDSDWVLVGVVEGVLDQATVYTNAAYLGRLMGKTGRASTLRVLTNSEDPAEHRRIAAALEQRFSAAGYHIALLYTRAESLEGTEYQFGILVNMLLVMTFLMALVGGLGLMGAMSISVIERTREIGVMRAIGAANRSILQIIIVEGVLIGLISWAQATILAWPLSRLLSDQVGVAFIDVPLSFSFSAAGIAIWLVIVAVVAALASYLPARAASRLTVREVLAYE